MARSGSEFPLVAGRRSAPPATQRATAAPRTAHAAATRELMASAIRKIARLPDCVPCTLARCQPEGRPRENLAQAALELNQPPPRRWLFLEAQAGPSM